MLIQKLDPQQVSRAYDVLCQSVHPWDGVAEAPFFATWCVVEPGMAARAHKHQEHEVFVIVKGRGVMRVDDEQTEVEPGDVIFMEPWNVHELTNQSADEELLFLDLCWEQMAEAMAAENMVPETAGGHKNVLSIATPPTPNGDFHVGHLSGPFLAADIHTRYRRLRGTEADYVTGADDHQSYVVTRARQLGKTPRELADEAGATMEETLRLADIQVDHWTYPKCSPHHVKIVQEVFKILFDRGILVAREAPTLFCEACEQWLCEAHVVGNCPHCGESSGGNACEDCGRPNDCVDLTDSRCLACGGKPSIRPLERIYFPLEACRDQLESFWSQVEMNPHMQALCARMSAAGLPDIAVSHECDWGIPVPVAGFESQRIYVWFEMAPGFLAATQELLEARGKSQDWRHLWCSDEHEVVQFFGFDNGYFFGLLFPAILSAYDPEIRLPTALVTNEFYLYQGSKFSTSRDHAMWGRELLDRVPPDMARFYLAYDNPEREQTNFTIEALEVKVEQELVQGWQAWLHDFGTRLVSEFDGAVPGTGAWTDDQQRFYKALQRLTHEAASAYEAATFSPQRAARILSEVVHTSRRFARSEEHWRGLPQRLEERRTAVALEALGVKTLALLASPIMPGFAAQLWQDLGYEGAPRWQEVPELVPGGRKIAGLGRPYFPSVGSVERSAVPQG